MTDNSTSYAEVCRVAADGWDRLATEHGRELYQELIELALRELARQLDDVEQITDQPFSEAGNRIPSDLRAGFQPTPSGGG